MYDYNWTKHMMYGIKHQDSERDGKTLDFGPGAYNRDCPLIIQISGPWTVTINVLIKKYYYLHSINNVNNNMMYKYTYNIIYKYCNTLGSSSHYELVAY